jgi:hypothetical protein
VEEKKQFNILTNYKYRVYLFCLLYRYTYGSNSTIDRLVAEYEEKKLPHSIMSTYSMILGRVEAVRSNSEIEEEMFYFVKFICGSKIIQELCTKHGLKKVTYEKIRESRVYFNLSNCNEYIRDSSSKSSILVTVNVERSIRAELFESKYDKILLKEGFTLEPANFYALKNKYVSKFYKKMTEESIKWEKPLLTLELAKIQFFHSRSEMKLGVPSVLLTGEEGEVLMKVSQVLLYKEDRTIFAASNKIIVSEKNNFLKVTSVFLNLQRALAEHLLTMRALLSEKAMEPLSEQEEFDNYLEQNIYQRLPKHPIFESFSDESTSLEVERLLVVTSVFEEGQYLVVDMNSLDYSSPNTNKPPKISLEKLSVTRSRVSNFEKLKHGKLEKLVLEHESLIVENNKPLALTSNKYLRKHNGNNYYESVLDIAIPFILLQISFQDIYYLQLLLNNWNELLSSSYLFPRRKGKTQLDMRVIEMNQHEVNYFEHLHTFTKSSRTRIKLEGLELILYGENRRTPQNEVLTMLLEGIVYENKVYILGEDTNLTIFNIFVENCLGSKTFNHLKLVEIIEKRSPTSEPLIYGKKYESEGSSLVLYGLGEGSEEEEKGSYMVKVKIKTHFSLKKFRKNTNVYTTVKPIFLFHSPDYYQILMNSFGLISKTAHKNFKPTFPIPKAAIPESDHEILEAKNISEKTVFVCQIEKINLIALHQNDPIYTFSFLDISVKHETEAYVSKYELLVAEFYVVDISVNCGLHPLVLKALPL